MRFLVILAAVAALSSAHGQQPPPGPPSMVVQGQAQVLEAPDRAVVRLGVNAEASTAQAAQEQASGIMQKILQSVTALKIAREDVQTSRITLSPVYAQPRPGDQPRITGYRATNVVSVRLSDFALIGRVIDAGITSGANAVEGVEFTLQDATAARARALASAVADARQKAEAMATALGVRLGPVLEVQESGAVMIPRAMSMARGMEMAAMDTPVEPGQLEISGNITIRFVILNPV
jgi:uncharacterized protein